MRLPKVDSATYRGIVTAIQAFLGFMVAAVALPEFRQLVQEFYPAALPILVSGAGIASFILNVVRGSVKNY
jgi:hypothetical protein